MLARAAAIKLIRPEMVQVATGSELSIALQRFEREAQATAMLTSPHTVELYDYGQSDDGTFFYVMEFLDGFDLETMVERFGPVPPERVIHFLIQACDSLADAHHSCLIHRDIKPANLFVCRRGRQHDFLKILDFGLVKAQCRRFNDDGRLTLDGTTTGTPAFMSPELATQKRDADERCDLYALGCVAYWLLTGELVYKGDTPIEMIIGHVQSEPVPPSQRTEVAVPDALETLILRCLSKDPARRPQSAEVLAKRLAKIELDEPWTEERAERWWQRHRPEGTPCPQPAAEDATSVGVRAG
jgi:serine/threonine-protein kinase